MSLLAPLEPTVVLVMDPEPGWVWACCPDCGEHRYQRRAGVARSRCVMTPRCRGLMETYLELVCALCGKAVTARRRGSDTRYCSQRCERAA